MTKHLMHSNAVRALMAKGPKGHTSPTQLPQPTLLSAAESTVDALQETVGLYAIALRDRAREGSSTSQDMKLTAMLTQSATKLADESRAQLAETSLSLSSDEDILQLVIATVSAIPHGRGVQLLATALAHFLPAEDLKDDT